LIEDFERSTLRRMAGGRATEADTTGKGPNGRNLCRWCRLEVPRGRRTFCSDFCVNEWRLRTDPGYLRERVLERDGGVCATCGLDCVAELRRLKRLRGTRRAGAMREWGLRPFGARSSLWDADHIVGVAEGGGECDLANLRTLCLKCHRAATAALRERLRTGAARSGTDCPRQQSAGRPVTVAVPHSS
jgi:5-methylcytosine-specific restriction enzyme A